MRRAWIISDLQVPYHDRRAVDAVAQCIADKKQPDDLVITIGDEVDLPQISRWTTGSAGEWTRTIGRDRDLTVQALKDLQVTDTIRSNHTDRLLSAISRRLPGLLGLPELELENFLRLPELGITFHRNGFRFAPGWIALHGDEGGLSQVAGQTAGGLTKRVGMSVACGHTHRLGLQPHTTGINGQVTQTLYGMEVGNLMDMRQATYSRLHNWQQGFGIAYINGSTVTPCPIPIHKKSFVVEGDQYKW